MDRFTEQLFGRSTRTPGGPDTRGLTEQMLHSFASSAAKRAMSYTDPDRQRGVGGGFEAEDFHALGGFVLDMMQGRKKEGGGGGSGSSERRRKKEKKRRERERAKEEATYDRDLDMSGETPYVPKYSTRRRRRKSQSPLHVKFAEPLEDYDYPPRKLQRRRRREERREEERLRRAEEEERQRQEAHERDERRRERRGRRQRGKIDMRALRTDLEDMSSTIISLNARSAGHRDCEFYDKFVRKGGMLQERIGSTLGQIRGWEEEGGEAGYDDGRERRERKRRRRERRW